MENVKFIGTFRHVRDNALVKAPEVVGKAFYPNGIVRATCEVTVFLHVASGGINDRVCLLSKK